MMITHAASFFRTLHWTLFLLTTAMVAASPAFAADFIGTHESDTDRAGNDYQNKPGLNQADAEIYRATCKPIRCTNTISTATDNLQISPKNEELACRRVSRRFAVCGDTNFRNRFKAGFQIRFNTIDPNGRLTAVGPAHEIKNSSRSCDVLISETFAPLQTRREAINVCRQMLEEHQAVQRIVP